MNTYSYAGYRLKPKHDFEGKGVQMSGKWVRKGWIIVDDNDRNVMADNAWFTTIKEAKLAVDELRKSA